MTQPERKFYSELDTARRVVERIYVRRKARTPEQAKRIAELRALREEVAGELYAQQSDLLGGEALCA